MWGVDGAAKIALTPLEFYGASVQNDLYSLGITNMYPHMVGIDITNLEF